METSKSIAIIGEGETEWFYFDSLRVALRYPFKVAPDMPQHSDIYHMTKMAEQYVAKGYDVVVCLVDMDRLLAIKKELAVYRQIRSTCSEKIMWVETNPCTEFWFLLHFLPELGVRYYHTCDEVVGELRRYMPGYEKTARYFRKTKLYDYLRTNGDLEKAMRYADQLSRLSEASPEDKIAYSEINRVLQLLSQWAGGNSSYDETKSVFSERIGEVGVKILEFLANSSDSDVKSISKAIGLKPSRVSDYLRKLVESGYIECIDGWKKTYRPISKK